MRENQLANQNLRSAFQVFAARDQIDARGIPGRTHGMKSNPECSNGIPIILGSGETDDVAAPPEFEREGNARMKIAERTNAGEQDAFALRASHRRSPGLLVLVMAPIEPPPDDAFDDPVIRRRGRPHANAEVDLPLG